MCVCPKYSDIRNNLFEAISKFVFNFDTLSLEETFLMLLTCSSQQSDVNLPGIFFGVLTSGAEFRPLSVDLGDFFPQLLFSPI